ncbi:phosphate acyltransferase PlsX [Phytohalomonas tamaricis]|uniref:phosphate acyltransferase PlsX n=1 Tax=Phytohalomonas tamaricis TaxID=2081032 RepID=UPI000D0B9538|nr:phosphate acyltransferase PlsX [Phytohalomonas tamaricis]
MRIAVDAMGGDYGPRATMQGAAHALQLHQDIEVLLYGPRSLLDDALKCLPKRYWSVRSRIVLVDAKSVISASARPSSVLRSPENSSLHCSLRALRDGEASACVSAGNTGALMAIARRYLGMTEGITRPAISTAVPTVSDGRCYMLDLGANVDCQPFHLVQFARMGAVMARVVDGLEMPRVALLNIGIEDVKGERRVRETDHLLRESLSSMFHYVGYIEGDDIFAGTTDVVVCDGFVGNVALKSSEGLARMLGQRLQMTFEANWRTRLVSLLARPALSRFKQELDPVRYNGASLLGLAETVVKSHGGADALGFSFAISRAYSEALQALPVRLAQGLRQEAG